MKYAPSVIEKKKILSLIEKFEYENVNSQSAQNVWVIKPNKTTQLTHDKKVIRIGGL